MNAARSNAGRLAADARFMLDAKRIPTAVALAALSIEESGKVSILRAIAIADSAEAIKKGWQQYRDHRSKNGCWILPELVANGARKLDDLSEIVNRDGEHTALLNSLKQIGLYTDCYGDAHWSVPGKIFEAKDTTFADILVKTAEVMARGEEVTVREVELWVEHLKPVWLTEAMGSGLMSLC